MKRLINILILLFFAGSLSAQDPHFTNFSMSPMYYNPAACGISDELSFRMSHKRMWHGLNPHFSTYKFSAEIYENKIGGLGIIAFRDQAGDGSLITSNAGICYSHKYALISNKVGLHLGMSANIVEKTIDWDNLSFDDEFDKTLGQIYQTGFITPEKNSKLYPDFNIGAIMTYAFGKGYHGKKRFYNELGFSMSHVTRPDYSIIGIDNQLPIKYVLHYRGIFLSATNKRLFTSPGVIYEQHQGLRTLNYGCNVMFDPLMLGVWVRNKHIADLKTFDAVSLGIGILLEPSIDSKLIIFYNHDFTISKLASGTIGSHEINIHYGFSEIRLFRRSPRTNTKRMPCPAPGFNW